MNDIIEAQTFSEQRLTQVRAAISEIVPSDQLVITCGSYARREASPESDMDYYSVLECAGPQEAEPEWSQPLKSKIAELVGNLPSSQGAFATNIARSELLNNYGGRHDSNESITRRMLYLLEGDYLTCKDKFLEIRRAIIDRYVEETPRDHQVAFYLLNDIIRYWRTMTVDYADKTYGSDTPKPWAIRNIKLIFSRKLIYASGIFSLALTADREKSEKSEILYKLFNMSPIDRIKYVCGEENSKRLFEIYSIFLGEIAKPEVREALDMLERADRDSNMVFRRLKNEGHYFAREIMGLFQKTFHASHPIHMAVIF